MSNPLQNRFDDPYYKVTRVEVIDKEGRSYTNYKVEEVELSLQDDDRTLKIFIKDKK